MANTIKTTQLKSTNTPTNGQIATYALATDSITWVNAGNGEVNTASNKAAANGAANK